MFPRKEDSSSIEASLLCMRRDVSPSPVDTLIVGPSSLHAQRCFPVKVVMKTVLKVFSACAEMFLDEEGEG